MMGQLFNCLTGALALVLFVYYLRRCRDVTVSPDLVKILILIFASATYIGGIALGLIFFTESNPVFLDLAAQRGVVPLHFLAGGVALSWSSYQEIKNQFA